MRIRLALLVSTVVAVLAVAVLVVDRPSQSGSVTLAAAAAPSQSATSTNLDPAKPSASPPYYFARDSSLWPEHSAAALEVEHYHNVRQMTRSATAVVRGRVVDVRPTRLVGREGGDGDPGVQLYGFWLEIDELLAGRLAPGAGVDEVIVEGLAPARTNTEGGAIFFLRHKGEGLTAESRETAPKGEERYYRLVCSEGLATKANNGKATLPMSEALWNSEVSSTLLDEVQRLSMDQLREQVLAAGRAEKVT